MLKIKRKRGKVLITIEKQQPLLLPPPSCFLFLFFFSLSLVILVSSAAETKLNKKCLESSFKKKKSIRFLGSCPVVFYRMCLVYPAIHTVRHQVWICWHWCLVYVTSNWNRRKVWNRIGNNGQQNKREHLVVIDTCFHRVELSIRSNGGYWNEVDVLIDHDINCYALSHCFTRLGNWKPIFSVSYIVGTGCFTYPLKREKNRSIAHTILYFSALMCRSFSLISAETEAWKTFFLFWTVKHRLRINSLQRF